MSCSRGRLAAALPLSIGTAFLSLSLPAGAQVVPSGATATSVSTATGGRQTVNIAPNRPGGLSYNSYTNFSVAAPGVMLDNRPVGARTIVNEVVSANRSVLAGPLEVLGARAHLIIANPNGITVDGGTFINTGGVVLGAGTITLQTRTPGPFQTQTNAVLNISGLNADIFVGSGGLGGTMASLQLYAGRIRVDGPVKVSPQSPGLPPGDIQLLAGKSSTEFDSAVLPIAALGNWATVTRRGTGSSEVLVDVTSRGTLEASRVYVGVTENGAGVSYAGKGLASAGDFRIDGSGQIGFSGADITAAANLRATGSAITVLNAPAQQSKLIAVNGALTLVATNGDLTNIGGLLQGETRDATDSDSRGGVTLTASGRVVMRTDQPDRLAAAFANGDDLVVTAGGNIENTAGRLLSNRQVSLTTAGNFVNTVEQVGVTSTSGTRQSYRTSHGRWWQVWRRTRGHGFQYDYGALAVPGQLAYVVGEGVAIRAANVLNRGGEFNANNGSLRIVTGQVVSEGVATGAAHFKQTCNLLGCQSTGASTMAINGGRLNASQDIDIQATGGVVNRFGQWLALRDLRIGAPSVEVVGLPVISVVQRHPGLGQVFQGHVPGFRCGKAAA